MYHLIVILRILATGGHSKPISIKEAGRHSKGYDSYDRQTPFRLLPGAGTGNTYSYSTYSHLQLEKAHAEKV